MHSFCTKVYGAGEGAKPDLSIAEQLKNAIKKRTSEVESNNTKNKDRGKPTNVVKLEELKDFINTTDKINIKNLNEIKGLNEVLKPQYTRSSKELSRLLEEAQELLRKGETLSPPEKKKLIDDMKKLKDEASAKEIALRKNPSKKFDPKILQQVNANLLAKASEAEILYNKKDPTLTDERIRQTLLLAQIAENMMKGLSNMNDILSGVEEKRSALNMAQNYFSKYDSDEKVYVLLQDIDKSLKTLDKFDQNDESGENKNTFALKNEIEALGHELYGKSMGFDRSDKENKEHLLKTSEEINKNISENKKLWDQNLSEIEELMKKVNKMSEEMKQAKPEIKKETPKGLSKDSAEKLRLEKKRSKIFEKSKAMEKRLEEDAKRFNDNQFTETGAALQKVREEVESANTEGDKNAPQLLEQKLESKIEEADKKRTERITEINKKAKNKNSTNKINE